MGVPVWRLRLGLWLQGETCKSPACGCYLMSGGQEGHPKRTYSQRSRRNGEGAWTQSGWTWELKKRWGHGSKGTSFWSRCCLCSAQLQLGVTQEVTPGSLQASKKQANCLGPQGREGRHSGRRPSVSSLTEERKLVFSTRRAPEASSADSLIPRVLQQHNDPRTVAEDIAWELCQS